jgi:histidine triad (HIT) family protein
MEDCIFCKIIKGEIPKDFRYEDDLVVAFDDINPKADTHVLFVPKKHYDSFDHLSDKDEKLLASVRKGVEKVVSETELNGRGYKILIYAGGAQSIDHLHFHLMGPVGLRV